MIAGFKRARSHTRIRARERQRENERARARELQLQSKSSREDEPQRRNTLGIEMLTRTTRPLQKKSPKTLNLPLEQRPGSLPHAYERTGRVELCGRYDHERDTYAIANIPDDACVVVYQWRLRHSPQAKERNFHK